MKHLFINNSSDYTLIMLHGTGGSEVEMARFAKQIDPNFNILSIRGNIKENGMNRFFKRFEMGSYDINSYIEESNNLRDAIIKYSEQYKINLNKSFIIGFSNGANIALGLLQITPNTVNNYILLSVDYINPSRKFNNLDNINILMSSSKNDPYTPFEKSLKLKEALTNANANVSNYLVPGHIITVDLLDEVKKFIELNK